MADCGSALRHPVPRHELVLMEGFNRVGANGFSHGTLVTTVRVELEGTYMLSLSRASTVQFNNIISITGCSSPSVTSSY